MLDKLFASYTVLVSSSVCPKHRHRYL